MTDPAPGNALVAHEGHSPTGARYEQVDLEYRGRDAIVVLGNSTVARGRLAPPGQSFFAMFSQGSLVPTPYGQIDASHLFEDFPVDVLDFGISGLCYCFGRNTLGLRQFEVSYCGSLMMGSDVKVSL